MQIECNSYANLMQIERKSNANRMEIESKSRFFNVSHGRCRKTHCKMCEKRRRRRGFETPGGESSLTSSFYVDVDVYRLSSEHHYGALATFSGLGGACWRLWGLSWGVLARSWGVLGDLGFNLGPCWQDVGTKMAKMSQDRRTREENGRL